MTKYRKKIIPQEVEAIQLNFQNWSKACDFITLPWGDDGVHGMYDKDGVLCDKGGGDSDKIALVIPTLSSGDLIAKDNDYIIKGQGIEGEFSVCNPDIFEAIYCVNNLN